MRYIDETQRDKVIQHKDGRKTFILPNGYEMIDATRYAWNKGDIIKKCIDLAMQYKILEEITEYNKNNDNIEEKSRKI